MRTEPTWSARSTEPYAALREFGIPKDGLAAAPRYFPEGSAQWQTRTIILSGDHRYREHHRPDAIAVETFLDLISQLEAARHMVVTVVLVERFAADRELVEFLVETYPCVTVVDGTGDLEADTYLPVYG